MGFKKSHLKISFFYLEINHFKVSLCEFKKDRLKILLFLSFLFSQSIYCVTTNVPPNLSSAVTFAMNAGDELIVSPGGSVICTGNGIPVITVSNPNPAVTITSTGSSGSPSLITNTSGSSGPAIHTVLSSVDDELNITNNAFSSIISNNFFVRIAAGSTAGTVNFNNNGGTVVGGFGVMLGQLPNVTVNITNSGDISNFRSSTVGSCNVSVDNSGTITTAPNVDFIRGSTANPAITYTITNQVGGTISAIGAGSLIETLTANTLATWNITNNGTMTSESGVAFNLDSGTVTMDMGANASTTGVIQGNGGATATLNFNGTYTLGGNVTGIQTVNVKGGTFSMGSSNLTGFTDFTVFNGATANLANTVTGTSMLNNGTINFNTNVTSSYINNSISNLNSNITGDFINNNGAVFNVSGNRTLTGNYIGNLGSTIGFSVTTPATYDSLSVSGVSTLNVNSIFSVTVNNSGAGVGLGDFFDVYLATTPQTVPQVASATAGYTFAASQSGNNIRLTITGVPPIPPTPIPTPNSTLTSIINLLSNSSSSISSQNIEALAETGISILMNPSSSDQSLVNFWNQIASLSPDAAIAALNQVVFNQNSVALLNVTTALTNSVNILQQIFSNLSQKISLNQDRISSLKQPLGYIAGDSINPYSSLGLVLYGSSEHQNVPQVNIFPSTTTLGGLGVVGNFAFNEIFNSGIGFSCVRSHSRINNLNAAVYQPMNIQSSR